MKHLIILSLRFITLLLGSFIKVLLRRTLLFIGFHNIITPLTLDYDDKRIGTCTIIELRVIYGYIIYCNIMKTIHIGHDMGQIY